jgi:hypothetical protein
VKASQAQVFLAALALFFLPMSIRADLTIGQDYQINFADVDGNALSTADGHITTVVLTSKANVDKAHTVGDRIPDFCLGNPAYRMITVIAFETNHSKPVRALLTSAVRRRVNAEAKQLQARYDRLKINQDARREVLAVADFDGATTAQFKSKWSNDLFQVFVLGKNGELINQWTDVPSAEELSLALKRD